MQTKTLQQTVTFEASPQEVYDMLMDSKKHRSLSASRPRSARRWVANSPPGALTYPASILC